MRSIFEEAVELPESDRPAFLARACGTDADLRAAVERLLANDPDAEGAEAKSKDALRHAVESLAGAGTDLGASGRKRLGAYVIERELGRGGMGTVYLARKSAAQYEHLVAIKVTPRLAGVAAEERFRQERQILALLDHPNIAQLFDGGTTEDGQPYLVMEYVQGEDLIEHCQSQGLTLEQRLALFQEVCAAVDYAHRRLVVHRDLKPSNVLVAEDGRPRLLDFGVAKLLDPGALPFCAVETATLHRVLTPGYASPEQIRGEEITTATDVFGLGLLLYEMICGQPAQKVTEVSPAALERDICETEPRAPSSILASSEAGPSPLAGPSLPKVLARDLDLIVLRALRKSPSERYASARELAEDLGRWLAGEPIRARKPTLAYVASKFLRRHRLGAALAAVALAGILAFSIALAGERRRARAEARTAQAVSDFLVKALAGVEPTRAQGHSVTLLEVLDAGKDRLETELVDEPLTRAHLQSRIGSIYGKLGDYDSARELQEEAVATFRSRAPSSDGLADSLNDLGQTWRDLGELEEARAILEEALTLRKALGPKPGVKTIEIRNDLGLVYFYLGRLEDAIGSFERAILERAQLPASADQDALLLEYNLALVLVDQGEFESAYSRLSAIVAERRVSVGVDHPRYLIAVKALAQAANGLGKFEECKALSAEAVAGAKRVYGETHDQYLDAINNAANQLHDQASFRAAEKYYLEAIAVAQKNHYESELPIYMNNLGALYRDMGDPARSVPWFRESVEIRHRVHGPESTRTANAERNLASVLIHTGGLEEAYALIEKTTAIYAAAGDRYQVLRSDHEMARWLLAAGETDRAEALFTSIVEGYREELREGHQRIGRALEDLGRTQLALGKLEAAESHLQEARNILRAAFDADHLGVAEVEVSLAAALVALDREADALALADHAEPILRDKLVPGARHLRELGEVRRSLLAVVDAG